MAILSCPECKHGVSDRARACPGCGYPLGNDPTASSSIAMGAANTLPPPVQASAAADTTWRVGLYHKLLLYSGLINALTLVPVLILWQYPHAEYFGSLIAVLAALFQLYCTYNLCDAIDVHPIVTVGFLVMSLIPCLSYLSLIALMQVATYELSKAGIGVGLMGCDLESIP